MIVVGTTNKRKCDVVQKLFEQYSKQEVRVVPFKADSQVPPTPWDHETYDGARNRALHSKKEHGGCEYAVGLESGLIERYGHIFEEAWACVITKEGKEYYGYSSGLKVPDFITNKMKQENRPHSEVMEILDKEAKRVTDDTWGRYTDTMLIRTVSLEEALRNALVQLFVPDTSYYKRRE